MLLDDDEQENDQPKEEEQKKISDSAGEGTDEGDSGS